jgi:hypothetical protein
MTEPWNHAEAGRKRGVEANLVTAGPVGLFIVVNRQVMQDRVMLGNGHVVRKA